MSTKAMAMLAASALTLLLLGPGAEAADSGRERSRKASGHSDAQQWRDQERADTIPHVKPRRAVRHPPRGNFGVGPDSYECAGYDCNW